MDNESSNFLPTFNELKNLQTKFQENWDIENKKTCLHFSSNKTRPNTHFFKNKIYHPKYLLLRWFFGYCEPIKISKLKCTVDKTCINPHHIYSSNVKIFKDIKKTSFTVKLKDNENKTQENKNGEHDHQDDSEKTESSFDVLNENNESFCSIKTKKRIYSDAFFF